MIADETFRTLAELQTQDRVVLSLYLADPGSLSRLEHRLRAVRAMLGDAPGGRGEAEQEHFDHNLDSVRRYLAANPHRAGSLCLFACWALDVLEAVPLTVPVADAVRVDSSPFIRPLAELRDEFETVAVVVADNRRARVFLVESGVAGDDERRITGNVKNHVRKGGWSQKRYQRRRDKELQHYGRDVSEGLDRLDREKPFARIVMVGGKEAIRAIEASLPTSLGVKLVGTRAADVDRSDDELHADIRAMLDEDERLADRRTWETIEAEVLAGGLGVAGIDDVLEAALAARVDKAIIDRTLQPQGARCRGCDRLHVRPVESCERCGSISIYPVGVVNELVELFARTGAEVEFVDPIPSLTASGGIGALLRY